MDSKENPFIITNPEFMRRMKEMQQSGGGMFGAGNMPDMFNLVINTNSELISQIINTNQEKQERLISKSDLAKLSHGLLSGEELTNFIKRSFDIIK